MRIAGTLAAALICAAAMAPAALAGDTTPPPGPVTGTMKTLTEVEPRTPLNSLSGNAQFLIVINQPGSYYLTADLVETGARHGLQIAADDVAIDLNGFRLKGPGNFASVGIVCSGSRTNFKIRNGTISDWGYASLNIGGFMTHCLFEDLTLTNNIAGGLEQAEVDHSVFRNIRVKGSGETGIVMGDNCVMTNCVVDGAFAPISGVFNCTVVDCVARNSTGVGISVFGNGIIEGCSTDNCKGGLSIGKSGLVRNCSVRGGEIGIESQGFARIEGCNIAFTSVEGIRLLQKDQVIGNKISNCPIGIRAAAPLGLSSVIDGNMLTTCPIGIQVQSPSNAIIRNIVTDAATNPFDIAPGNSTGSIQATPVGAGAWDNIAF